MRTVGAGLMTCPATTVVGCWTYSSAVAVPAESVIADVVSLAMAADEKSRVFAPIGPVSTRPGKVARPEALVD